MLCWRGWKGKKQGDGFFGCFMSYKSVIKWNWCEFLGFLREFDWKKEFCWNLATDIDEKFGFCHFFRYFQGFRTQQTVPVQDQRTLKSWKRGDSLKILFKGRFKTFWPKLDLHRAIFDTFPNVWKFLIIHDSWIMSKYCLKFLLKSFHVLIESLPIEWFLNHKNDYFIKKSIK